MAFPTWNGELYLQYHRGTLTNVAKNKANNRGPNGMLRELEFLSAMAMTERRALSQRNSSPSSGNWC
jgi:alpha-mannosidase